jgi:hypothetical protein
MNGLRFKLYLELALRAQDESLLDLLRFPDDGTLTGGEWDARWWSHGQTKRKRSPNREQILDTIANDGINELDLKWHAQAPPAPTEAPSLIELWTSFTPSRTSALWAPVPTQRLQSPADERNRKSFGGGVPANVEICRQPHPSTLECFLTFGCEGNLADDAVLQNKSIAWLVSAIPAGLVKQDYFGYGCVHETCRIMSMVQSMGGVAPWVDQLGQRFENIYPIMIGPTQTCNGLAAALGDRCSLVRISERSATAIVSIPPDKVAEIRQDPAVKEWVVIRDLADLEAPPETKNEIYRRQSELPHIAPFLKR